METYTKAQIIEIMNLERGETQEYNAKISQRMAQNISDEKLMELANEKGIVLRELGYNRFYFA